MSKGGELKLGRLFRAGPEGTGIAVTVIATPDGNESFVVAACYTLVVHMAEMKVFIISKHTGGAVMGESFLPCPVDIVCRFI